MPGVDIEFYQKQSQGIQMVGARNAQLANRKGLPNRDTDRRVRRREAWRAFRYDAAERGFFTALKDRLRRHGTEQK